MPFFIIFVIIPLIEILVFMEVGQEIGIFTTLMLALLTAIIGGFLVKLQGLQTLIAIKVSLDHGKVPLSEIFDGFCLVAAGALLITPGFVTDAIGFSLLIPQVRNFLRQQIRTRTSWHAEEEMQEGQRYTYKDTGRDTGVIEGEYERLDDEDEKV